MEKRNYVGEFLWLWVKTVILFALGGAILGGFVSGSFDWVYGLIVVAVLYGFTFFNKVVPFNLFGNSDAVIVFWVLKIIASCIIGVIALPIVNIYYIVHIIIDVTHKSSSKTE